MISSVEHILKQKGNRKLVRGEIRSYDVVSKRTIKTIKFKIIELFPVQAGKAFLFDRIVHLETDNEVYATLNF